MFGICKHDWNLISKDELDSPMKTSIKAGCNMAGGKFPTDSLESFFQDVLVLTFQCVKCKKLHIDKTYRIDNSN